MIFTIRSTEKHGSQSPDNNQMETSQSTEAPEEPVVTSQIQTRLVKTSTAETLMRVYTAATFAALCGDEASKA
jgi:hypothetical protein